MTIKRVTRRAFLKDLMVMAGAGILGACASPAQPTKAPEATKAPAADKATEPPKPTAVPAAAGKTKIVFSTWADVFAGITKPFNEGQSAIEVSTTIVPYGEYDQKLMTQFAGGTAPDVIWTPGPLFPVWAYKDVLLPIQPLLDTDKPDVAGLAAKPEVWCKSRKDGKIYGMPMHAVLNCRGLAYNIGLFKKAGVDLPKYADWTMDDLDAAVKKIAKPPDIWGATVPLYNGTYLELILSNGGSLFNEDETKCLLNTDKARAVFKYSVDWLLKSKIAPTPAQQQLLGERVFASDKLATTPFVMTDWDSFKANTKDLAIEAWVAMWPKMPGGKRVSTGDGHPFVMPKSGKNTKAGWEFIKYWLWNDTAIQNILKIIPCNYKFIENAKKAVTDPKQLQFLIEPAAYADTIVPTWWGLHTSEVLKIFKEELEAMHLGAKTIEQATDDMVKRINVVQAQPA